MALAHPRKELDGDGRVPAELEEVVVDADALEPEDVGPQPGELLLERRAGSHEDMLRLAGHIARRGKHGAVHLAVGCERQCRERHEDRRHHVLWQLLSQEAA